MVAMSGGLDSAVAALLLKRAGHEVVGATLRLLEGGSRCCSLGDIDDAKRTCQVLGIPHYTLDSREPFKAAVLDKFMSDTRAGLTPNPCVGCNSRIKFGYLLEQALAMGCDFLATGHYARVVARGGRRCIARGRDRAKDQSYFLFDLSQTQLAHMHFPLADLVKDESRALAAEAGIIPADKPESQDLCFIPNNGHAAYLREQAPDLVREGAIVTLGGQELGRHQGSHFYTIGQRRGLGLGGGPWYVVALQHERNQVVVGPQHEVCAGGVELRGVRWQVAAPTAPLPCRALLRYHHGGVEAVVHADEGGIAELTFAEPQFAVTPGQAAVFYDGDTVLGGGWIARPLPVSAATDDAATVLAETL